MQRRWIWIIVFALVFIRSAYTQKMTVKDSDSHVLMEVNDEGVVGSISLPSGNSPSSTSGKLYNLGGTLYWSGGALGTAGIAGGWMDEGTSIHTITSTDKVGIGTSSPLYELHVVGSPPLGSILISPNETGSEADSELLLSEDNDNTFGMSIKYDGGFNQMYIYGKSSSSIYGPHIAINRNNGYVGIGNTNPQNVLDVSGTIQTTGFKLTTNPSSGYVLTSDVNGIGTWQASTGGSFSLPYYGETSHSSNPAFYVKNNSSGGGIACATYGSSAVEGVNFGDSGAAGYFAIANTSSSFPAIYAETNGTASAIWANGTVEMSGFKLTTSPASGYVLTSDASGEGTWQPAGGFSLPYFTTVAVSSSGHGVFHIINTGTEEVIVGGSQNGGTGVAGASMGGVGVMGVGYGDGFGGRFYNMEASNTKPALTAQTYGTGPAIRADGAVEMTGFKLTTSPSDGYVLTSDINGVGTWQPAGGGGFTLPYSGNVNTSGAAFSVTNINATNGRAAYFFNSSSGNSGAALYAGTNGPGLAIDAEGTVRMSGFQLTTSPSDGYVLTSNASGVGTWKVPPSSLNLPYNGMVNVISPAFTITNIGNGGAGFFNTTNSSNTSPTILAESSGYDAAVIEGYNLGGGAGAYFENNSPAYPTLWSVNTNTAATYNVYVDNNSSGYGLYSINRGSGNAITGWHYNEPYGYAGYFHGSVYASFLVKGGGSFMIDHPLDPENKFLCHSFVESPDMKNIYDGVIELDLNGEAIINLPDWFEALNREFRYQLTCIGSYAQVYISSGVKNNSFAIAGGKPGQEISWQVTGIRKDEFAEKNRIVVEKNKKPEQRGKYLHPLAHNKPESMGIETPPERLDIK
ncbi:hypothetical protein ACFL4L_02685 [bacterium]